MGYPFPGVDHRGRRLADAFERPTRRLMAEEGGQLVGTLQFNWGAECPFTEEERRIYRLSDFVALVGDESTMIASRFMTRPSHRDSDLPARMLDAMFEFALDNEVKLLVADCRPHLINNYLRLGFRTYANTYNDPTVGMLAPLIFVIDDVAHLERIKSRLAPLFRSKRPGPQDEIVAKIAALLPQATPVRLLNNPAGSPDWMSLQDTLVEDEVSIFHGMEPDEVARLIEMSPVISCASGDRIVGPGPRRAQRVRGAGRRGRGDARRQVGGADDARRGVRRDRVPARHRPHRRRDRGRRHQGDRAARARLATS